MEGGAPRVAQHPDRTKGPSSTTAGPVWTRTGVFLSLPLSAARLYRIRRPMTTGCRVEGARMADETFTWLNGGADLHFIADNRAIVVQRRLPNSAATNTGNRT